MTHSPQSSVTCADVPNPWRHHAVRIERVKREVADVATYDLSFVEETKQQRYRFAPGQFNMLYLPGAGEMAISVSDDPQRRDAIAHTIRTAGNVTGTLSRLNVGDTLGLRGPFGTAWPMTNASEKTLSWWRAASVWRHCDRQSTPCSNNQTTLVAFNYCSARDLLMRFFTRMSCRCGRTEDLMSKPPLIGRERTGRAMWAS